MGIDEGEELVGDAVVMARWDELRFKGELLELVEIALGVSSIQQSARRLS